MWDYCIDRNLKWFFLFIPIIDCTEFVLLDYNWTWIIYCITAYLTWHILLFQVSTCKIFFNLPITFGECSTICMLMSCG